MRYQFFTILPSAVFSIACMIALLAVPQNSYASPPAELMMNDTTRAECGVPSTYTTWIDQKQFEVVLSNPGRLVVTPPAEVNFTFDTPCNDTVRHLLEVFDSGDNLIFSELAVLIVMDTVAPTISSTLADTIRLGCNDIVPDASTVSIMDNCEMDTILFNQTSKSGGNCAITDTIVRTWEAIDICGNRSNYQQTIIIRDDLRPVFIDLPPLVDTVGCMEDAHPDFTGYPTAFDSCDTEVDITFNDQELSEMGIPDGCNHRKTITRIWFITDDCGNTNSYLQTIRVIDTIPPSFTVPNDTTVSCEVGDDPFFTGFPILEQTDCDSLTENNYRFEDQISAGSCDNEYQVKRTWFVFDNCGNIDSAIQNINVIDTIAPQFEQAAQDLLVNCALFLDVDSLYNNWINTHGSAMVSNNCSADSLVTWQALVSGTSTPATFPMRTCNDRDQIILEQVVDFIATDICGNSDTSSARFAVLDDLAPSIDNCPMDTTISTRTFDCNASFTINRPEIMDECSVDSINFPGLSFSYRIDDGADILVSGNSTDILLSPGTYQMTYYATDCGGNQDSCQFTLTVIDDVPPQIICPSDISLSNDAGICTADLTLPIPQATDNCAIDPDFVGPRPIFYAEGATTISPTKMVMGDPPTRTFNLGTTTVYYVIEDASGNRDTCNFDVTVNDMEDPVARCQPTTLFINPSGLDIQTIDVGDVNAGSSDNCGIDSLFLTPNLFRCETQVGSVEDIILSVVDESGNLARCTTFVRIENLGPQPSANAGLCGNDTLFLQANPPPAQGGTVYTFRWSGPNGFTSTRENPIIPNIRALNAGSYSVEITGLTGCTATGSVEVSIEDLPSTPEILAEDNYCINSFITLRSSIAPQGAQVIYRWFKGSPPSGTLIAETIVPSFSFQAVNTQASGEYYVTIEADACLSQPSQPRRITVNEFPIAIPQDTTITVCSGERISLGTQVIGTGITYQWTGPNGYNESGQFPRIIEQATTANDGIYSLVVFRNGCPSAPAFVRVNVIQSPLAPMLSNNGPICEGEQAVLSTNAQATIYRWVAPDLTEFSTNTNTFTLDNASRSANGEWRLIVTDFNCSSELSMPSNLVVNDLPNTVAAVSPDIICEGSTLTLNASPNITNASYAWSGPDNFNAVGRNVSIENVRNTKSGNYSVTITTEAGCSNNADVTVDVKASVRIIAATNDGPACLSGPTDIRLNAAVFPNDNGAYRYSWSGPNGFISNEREAIIPNATALNNGNYQLMVTNDDGCVSEPAITVVDVSDPPATPIAPRVSEITPIPFCVGAPIKLLAEDYTGTTVTYHWQTPNDGLVITNIPELELAEAELADSGDYTVFVNVDGCNSNPSTSLRVSVSNRPSAIIASNSPVCEGSRINLQANFIAGATYDWVGPNFSSSLQNPSIAEADSMLHSGRYDLIIEREGCESEMVSIFVGIDPSPEQPQIIGNSPICGSEEGTLLRLNLSNNSVTNNARYIWNDPTGILDTTDNPSLDITAFEDYPDGTNAFTVQALLGNCLSDESEAFNAVINKTPESQAFAGQDFTSCETEQIALNGEAPTVGSGRWTLSSTDDTTNNVIIINPSLPSSSINGLKGGNIYTFRWTLSNGACQDYSFDEVTINLNKVEEAQAGDDQIACASSGVQLNANPVSGNSFWTQPEAQSLFGVRITDPTDPNTGITGLQPGNLYSFTWNVRGSCGDERDDVLVLISDPNPFAGPDVVACNEEGFAELMANEPTDGSKGLWSSLSPDVQITAVQSPNTFVTDLSPGTFQFVWEVDNGTCGDASRDTVQVIYKRNPIVRPESFQVGFGQPIEFNVLDNDETPVGSQVLIVQAPEHGTLEDLGNGRYRFQPFFNYVGNDQFFYEVCSEACECVLGEVSFNIGRDAQCTIPSIITPNNDGVNDEFIIPCLFDQVVYPNSQLIIINRWGDEVFRSGTPYNNDWNGTFNGEPLPVGTYFYILDFGDGQAPVNSFFMIQR